MRCNRPHTLTDTCRKGVFSAIMAATAAMLLLCQVGASHAQPAPSSTPDTAETLFQQDPPPKKKPKQPKKKKPKEPPEQEQATPLPADSVAVDSVEQRRSRQPQAPSFEPDTTAPALPEMRSLRIDRTVYWRTGYKDAGEALGITPGLFPRQSSYFAEPFHLVPPGGGSEDLLVLYRGRPFNDPVTGAASLSAIAVGEIGYADYTPVWNGLGRSSSGPVLELHTPYRYPTRPLTRIAYRQGLYSLGHADWRIQQKVSPFFRYHIGIDGGEYAGRKPNTDSKTIYLRLGGRQKIYDWGWLELAWMQNRIDFGYANEPGIRRTHRNDLDAIFTRSTHSDSVNWLAAAWYVRSERKYLGGREDGNRLGMRLRFQRQFSVHELAFQTDVERTAALFGTFPIRENPKGERLVTGVTASDKLTLGLLNTDIALRGELGDRAVHPDGRGRKLLPRLGGTGSVDIGDTLGHGLLGLASLGWRWPSLDQSYGFWAINSPERYNDLFPVPDSSFTYSGNAALDPVGGLFAGGGYRYRFSEDRLVKLTAGYRKYIDPVVTVETQPKHFTRETGEDVDGLEFTGFAWTPSWGPWSMTGAWTWSALPDEGVPVPNTWGFAGLRFEKFFYEGQLRVRASTDARYWGSYTYLGVEEPGVWHLNALLSVKVISFEIYIGNINILSNQYEFQPGYPSMFREEIWGVRWTLWN